MKRLMSMTLWVLLSLLTHDTLAQHSALSQNGVAEINRFFSEAIHRGEIPAVEAVVVNKDAVLYHEVFGKQSSGENIDLRKHDLFDIASMTKPVTSVAAMILYDEGKLGLDDPITEYLPAFEDLEVLASFNQNDTTYTTIPPESPITIRHLLNHTSGMAYPWWDQRLQMIVAKTEDTRFFHYDYLQLPLLSHPGENWSYGISSRVLGDLIEVVAGERLDDVLHDRIFQPLGMHNTVFSIPAEWVDRRVKVYIIEEDDWIENPADQSHQPFVLGDATLISTGGDFARFLQMLLNNGKLDGVRILSKESTRTMTENQIGDLFVRELFNGFPFGAGIDKFGLGFQIRTDASHERLMRSPGSYSWAGSYNTFFWVDPEREIAAVLLMQYLPFHDETAQRVKEGFERRVYESLR